MAAASAKRSFPPIVDATGAGAGARHLARRGILAPPAILRPSAQSVLADPVRVVRRRAGGRLRGKAGLCDGTAGGAVGCVHAVGEREASADATIRREIPNAIDRLLDAHPSIARRRIQRHRRPPALRSPFPAAARHFLSGGAVDEPGARPARLCRQAFPLDGLARGAGRAVKSVKGRRYAGRALRRQGVTPGKAVAVLGRKRAAVATALIRRRRGRN